MKILLTGSTGLIGSAILKHFIKRGDEVVPITRSELLTVDASPNSLWENADIVIHLAGESVASGFWTKSKMSRIKSSRVKGTKNLVSALNKLNSGPKAFLSASAIGFYGSGRRKDESSPNGASFLSEVCMAWEKAASPLKEQGVRVVHLRLAHVIANNGGILRPLMIATKLFLGAVLGSGEQLMSWIGMKDLIRAVDWLIEKHELEGPFNIASPNSITQRQFAQTIGDFCHRPVFLRIPGFILKLFLGKMAVELFLTDLEAIPKRLLYSGFEFKEIELAKTIRLELDS